MKTTILSLTLATPLLGALHATAGEFGAGSHLASLGRDAAPSADVFERRGRGHGRNDDRSGDEHGGGHGGRAATSPPRQPSDPSSEPRQH